jgi:hypothetical protein
LRKGHKGVLDTKPEEDAEEFLGPRSSAAL